jgi:hypothetical protein
VVFRAPLFGKKFQGDGTVQSRVLRSIDDTHASASQLFDQAIVGDALGDHRAPDEAMLMDSF